MKCRFGASSTQQVHESAWTRCELVLRTLLRTWQILPFYIEVSFRVEPICSCCCGDRKSVV